MARAGGEAIPKRPTSPRLEAIIAVCAAVWWLRRAVRSSEAFWIRGGTPGPRRFFHVFCLSRTDLELADFLRKAVAASKGAEEALEAMQADAKADQATESPQVVSS